MKSQKSGPFFETRIAISQSLSSCWVAEELPFLLWDKLSLDEPSWRFDDPSLVYGGAKDVT